MQTVCIISSCNKTHSVATTCGICPNFKLAPMFSDMTRYLSLPKKTTQV